jgi:hypothetical protein
MKDRKKESANCDKAKPEMEYTPLQELVDNLPYIFMTILGALVFIVGSGSSDAKWLLAGSYVFYGVAGALWIVIFVCPYCHYYGTRTCPCGYGRISARLRKVRDQSLFSKKFKKHIPVIVPIWVIPVVAGTIFLADNFSYLLMTLVVLFAVDAFFVLPMISRKYGCAHCPQKDTCPWMST